MSEIFKVFNKFDIGFTKRLGPGLSISSVWNLTKLSKSCGFCRGFHLSHSSRAKPQQHERNKEIIARVLGTSVEDVNKKPPRKLINEELAVVAFKVLQDYGFGSGQVLEHPDVFMMAPTAVQNYVEIMNESCFKEIKLQMIINFRNVHKQTLKFLQEKDIIPAHLEILQNYCKVLGISNTKTEDDLWNSLPNDINRLTLTDLRRQVIVQYLNLKLDANQIELTKTFTMYPRTENRCMKWIKDSLHVLLDVLHFPKEKVIKHSYLLHGNPFNMSQVVREIPTLSGTPLQQLALSRPKILMCACSSLKEIEKLFCEHKIPQESIVKYPEIYTLSPVTVKERLEELDDIPEFRPLKRHHRVARLLYYQNKAKSRIEYLRSLHLSGASLHLLSADTKRFNKLIALGELKSKGSDIANSICEYLGPDAVSNVVRKNLMRQPHWLHCSLMNVEECLQFLDSFKIFTKPQIFSALPILLYPKEKIEKEFENVVASGEAKMSDEFFLHMVLYFLERSVHFSGDGLWTARHAVNADDDDNYETHDSDQASENLENEDHFNEHAAKTSSMTDTMDKASANV